MSSVQQASCFANGSQSTRGVSARHSGVKRQGKVLPETSNFLSRIRSGIRALLIIDSLAIPNGGDLSNARGLSSCRYNAIEHQI